MPRMGAATNRVHDDRTMRDLDLRGKRAALHYRAGDTSLQSDKRKWTPVMYQNWNPKVAVVVNENWTRKGAILDRGSIILNRRAIERGQEKTE